MEINSDEMLLYLKRRTKMNEWSARKLIRQLDEVIQGLREKARNATSRLDKNLYYQQIENRKLQISWANQFLPTR